MSHELIIRNFNLESFSIEGASAGGASVGCASVGSALDILKTACTRPPARAPDTPLSTR